MQPFRYQRAASLDAALVIQQPNAKFIGGGTNLIDLMKGGVEQPALLIDITGLSLDAIEATAEGGLMIGAGVRNSDLAHHRLVRTQYPLLSKALLSGASPQLRNMATVGGNLLQRTRCYYFYDIAYAECNKRLPGSGCAAQSGVNRLHAILGASEQCVATHPSDMCVALAALDARVQVQSARGARSVPIEAFLRLPGNTPERDHDLAADEMIVAVLLPPSRFAAHAHYLKLRDRSSYAFALVSVAAALDLTDGHITQARIVLGGVAHKPWRARQSEQLLIDQPLSSDLLARAGELATQGAQPLRDNAFKVPLAQRAVARALAVAGGLHEAA